MPRRFGQILLLVLAAGPFPCRACTTFVLSDGDALLFARNFDWPWGDGFLVVNQRGIQKTALVLPLNAPARWTSKYGSVTFNQFGREMPYGGINERGLVVEMMMLFDSEYPAPDERPAVNMLQWIQYQLDNCQTVEEVIATDASLRLATPLGKEKIHYLVCDASGDAATIELLGGKMVCRRGEALPAKALTNDAYCRSIEFTQPFVAAVSADTPPPGSASLHRFARAAKCSLDFRSRSAEDDRRYAFEHLRDVAQGQFTVWSIVYDVAHGAVFYRTGQNDDLRWFSLDDFNYAPAGPPIYLDVNASGAGRVCDDFQDLTDDVHRGYLYGFFGKQGVKEMMGDMTPIAVALMATLKSYRPGVPEPDRTPAGALSGE